MLWAVPGIPIVSFGSMLYPFPARKMAGGNEHDSASTHESHIPFARISFPARAILQPVVDRANAELISKYTSRPYVC